MDISELEARLMAMEEAKAAEQEEATTRGFIDKYGAMFSGDEGIGMAILAEMNRRGVDAAAVGADKVIQEILDAIRMEATQLLDKIKAQTAEVSALMDEVQTIQESVAAATGGGDAQLDIPPVVEGEIPVTETPIEAPLPPIPPEGGDIAAAAPIEEIPPPEPQGELPPPIPPAPIASDQRVKRTISVKPKQTGWKPPVSMLNAIKGGI